MTDKLALVVDDSRVARMMLCKLLQASGFAVVEQGSADDALTWLETTTQPPIVIFMDLMMPGMDGLTATRQIKNNVRWQSIPVVLCTSNDSEADKLSAHESGVLALLSKPPESHQLQTILNDLSSADDTAEIRADVAESSSFTEIPVAPSIEEVIAQVEQQLLPSWLQHTQHATEQISQQIAENIARQLIDEKLDGLAERLSVELKQQISAGVQDKVEQQLATQAMQMQTVLSEKAADAAETAMQNLNQSNHWQQQFTSQTEQWLASQQQIIQQQLLTALQPKIETVISEQLAAIPDSVDPRIETLQQELAQLQLMYEQLVKRQRTTSALLMVALAAGVFALLQINLF
jgi:CheY-like chemotaxis protein